MKILAVAGNGALIQDGEKVELRSFKSFLTAGQKRSLVGNKKYEQKVYTKMRKQLEAKVVKRQPFFFLLPFPAF